MQHTPEPACSNALTPAEIATNSPELVERMRGSRPDPALLRALEALESALGWSAARALRDKRTVPERITIARSSAGLADLLAPKWQTREIKRALHALALVTKEA